MTTEILATYLANATSVFTSMITWLGNVGTAVLSTPVLFVPCVIGIAFVAAGLFMKLRG